MRELERLVARVVDRRLALDSTEKRLTGIPTELLYGHPTAGGFGALPIRQHRQPWCVAYDVYLRAHHPSLRPSSTLTAVPVAEGAGDIIPPQPPAPRGYRAHGFSAGGLVGDIPPSWWSAAQAHAAQLASPGPAPVPAPSTSEVVRTTIMPRMGWKLSGSETLKVPLAKLSFRMATSMQLDDVATRRADLHEDYERAAQGLPPRGTGPAAALWCGGRTCQQLRLQRLAPLGTPWRAFGRSQAQLWLVQAPPGFQQCVWDVVVMAALAATEHGRPGVNPVELARAGAVADFWSRLMQFAQLGVPQKGWGGIDATHPILAVVNGEMLCALPQAMELEA
eukprot:XP_001695274.1 predicted protein [Chlamydomonas reinhardtii]